jgi:ribosomal-protein-alanine N-acetyltransferase
VSARDARAVDVTIRPYQLADRSAVADITASSWVGVTMAELREQKVGELEGKGWREHKTDAVLQAIDNDPERVLVAVVEDTVIGYATFRVQGEVGTVADNAVHPDWQGRGAGTRLIAAVLDRLREGGVRLLEVTTFEHDAPARAVYEKFGFELVASSVHYSMDASAPSVPGT